MPILWRTHQEAKNQDHRPTERRSLDDSPRITTTGDGHPGDPLNVALIGSAGFTIASTILFVCVARGFGSKNPLRDALIGATFALIAYVGFATTLGINIGSGFVESGIERLIGVEGP